MVVNGTPITASTQASKTVLALQPQRDLDPQSNEVVEHTGPCGDFVVVVAVAVVEVVVVAANQQQQQQQTSRPAFFNLAAGLVSLCLVCY